MKRLLVFTTHSQITRSFRHEANQQGKQAGWNSFTTEHVSPSGFDGPRITFGQNTIHALSGLLDNRIGMIAQDEEVYEIHHQLTEDDSKLIPRHQCTTHLRRCNLSNIHRADSRCQTYTDTTQYTIEIECYEQAIRWLSMFEEQKFRIVRTECRQEKQDTRHDKRSFSAQIGSHETRQGTTNDTAYQGTGRGESVHGIGIHKIGCSQEESLKPFFGSRDYGGIIPKEQTAQNSHNDYTDEIHFTLLVFHDI